MDTLLASITDLTVRIDRFQYCIAAAVATLLQPERAVPRTGESSLLLSDVYDSEAQQISLFLDLLLYLSLSFFFTVGRICVLPLLLLLLLPFRVWHAGKRLHSFLPYPSQSTTQSIQRALLLEIRPRIDASNFPHREACLHWLRRLSVLVCGQRAKWRQ